MTEENVAAVPAPATVSVQDFTDLVNKVYAIKDPAPFSLTDDPAWKSLVTNVSVELTGLAARISVLENANKSLVPAPSSPDTSALEAQVADIKSRLETFNRRSGQHI